MIKALFVDFYGTVVHEDGAVIKVITQMIKDTGDGSDTSDIGSFWWTDFQTILSGGLISRRCSLIHLALLLRLKGILRGNHWNIQS